MDLTRDELSVMLGAEKPPVELMQWLRTRYFPELLAVFNSDSVRKRLGLYQGERIPENERNLTDVRNRVSLIVEYELARISNKLLEDAGEPDLFWAYVVANRFPDLEVRRRDGTRCLRIEVKNLQSIAEEKSANFDTLKKDINPKTDFVVVFLWEWGRERGEFAWDRAPKLLDCFVFHASSLAELRDSYWLNRPHANLGDGFQGFDLRHAVNCNGGAYSEEEGNYGKLLRIWQNDFEFRPPTTPELLDTEAEYSKFRNTVVPAGFWSLCALRLPLLSENSELERLSYDGTPVGARSREYGFFLRSLISNDVLKKIMTEKNLTYAVVMTEKYVCTGYKASDAGLEKLFGGIKPKALIRREFGLL